MADTVLTAFRMNQADRSARMKRMRRNVREENVFRWVDSFLKAGATLGGGRSSRAFEKRRRSATLQNAKA
jgi:trehalose-6-phosphate synthase